VADLDQVVRQQALLADLLTAPDPVAALHECLSRADSDPELRAIDENGLRIAALLVVKLRFQRLTNGSRLANEWFERDPRGFTDAFRVYHHEVPPIALDPWREAVVFQRWCDASGHPDTTCGGHEPDERSALPPAANLAAPP
jgi:hypothetical protein